MSTETLAPLVLIGFTRCDHFKKTLVSLANNDLAINSNLYIFLDGPRSKKDHISILKNEQFSRKHKKYFRNIHVIKREINLGLAKNITSAVTEIVNKYGKVIVIEDDIVTSKNFLKFMNDALNYYEEEKKVWHIGAHTMVNDTDKENLVFFWKVMTCWGWATWSDRWQHYEKNPDNLLNTFSKEQIKEFNLYDSARFWHQVIENKLGLIDTWAIFWHATIFRNKGYCLNPYFSYVENIGLDGTGVNSGRYKKLMQGQKVNKNGIFKPLVPVQEDMFQIKRLKNFYSKNKRYNQFKLFVKRFMPKSLISTIKKILSNV